MKIADATVRGVRQARRGHGELVQYSTMDDLYADLVLNDQAPAAEVVAMLLELDPLGYPDGDRQCMVVKGFEVLCQLAQAKGVSISLYDE